jgi:hypothetical protein
VPLRLTCRVKFDRFQVLAQLPVGARPPEISGYQVVRDSFVRSQTTTQTYARVRELLNPTSGTQIFIQYHPALPGLSPFKLTLVSDDRKTMPLEEIRRILGRFTRHRFSLVEVAWDFQPTSGIDLCFVRRCALFGKSRRNISRLYALSALYGSRKGQKLVRCYSKKELNSFRVELELHSAWLRRYGISQLEDLRKLPASLFPNHFRFVDLDWKRLEKCLLHRGLQAAQIIEEAKQKSDSIHGVLWFLRRSAGVNNAHRFLVDGYGNQTIQESLKKWSQQF